MSVTLMTALLLQLSAVLLLRHRLGKTWLRRPVTLLVLASVVYQGVSPALLSFPSIGRWDSYRIGVQQSYVDQADLILSGAMLAFTVCYLLTRPERVMAVPEPGDVRLAARVLDWRLLALCALPLAVLTYHGRGYGGTSSAALTPASTSLAVAFFIILTALAAFAFLLRHGARWFLPVLAGQSLLLAAAGERSPVLVDAIVLVLLLCHAGARPSSRQLRAAAALTVIAGVAITGVRAEQGRMLFRQDSGLGARVAALGDGITALGASRPGQQKPGLLAAAATRLDGADFAGAVLQAEHLGQPRLSASAVPESLLIAVPSALWPGKPDKGNALNPTQAQIDDLGLQQVNFLPTLPGIYMGFMPWPWLVLLLAGAGLLSGMAERALLRQWSPARLVLLAGAVTAALQYEMGAPAMLVTLRTAAVIACAAAVAAVLARRVPVPVVTDIARWPGRNRDRPGRRRRTWCR